MAREPAELLQLGLGERRAHRGDDRLHARLVEREHVRVALDDDRPILLRDRGAGEVEPVHERALAEELALGRVHVLRRDRVVVAQPARTEAEHAAAPVGERKDEATRVVVVAAPVHEPGRDELLLGIALLASLLGEHDAARRKAEPELLAHLLRQPALAEVGAHRLAGGGLPERSPVVRRRLFEKREEPLLALPPRFHLGRGLLVLERDAVAVGQPLDRAHEVEALGLADERDEVSPLPAAVAVEELVGRVDGEARRAVLVERAPAHPARAALSQLRPGAHDLDHVGDRLDLLDRGLGDYRHARAKRSVIPAT